MLVAQREARTFSIAADAMPYIAAFAALLMLMPSADIIFFPPLSPYAMILLCHHIAAAYASATRPPLRQFRHDDAMLPLFFYACHDERRRFHADAYAMPHSP